ncbi:CDP-glucose 4,6-dehydratase [Paenibacillus tianmuensis]|uniref:CDP-glucose 4,6-dehydratase n=1 Tax=Paenibacillus tianmuensis TaxID=624147 RepID=A0A1G4QRC2_9BACL|nr:CDP-glucose 4,6-dehydratase [Paenibacillus tianmuensis]SCW47102.1 CDP-glucose 4,6-dehydratase [Paenibacillus tianmuensis]
MEKITAHTAVKPTALPPFWEKKRVFVTGHTGFKGGWLCMWLHLLGAEITGYALKPPTRPNLFEEAGISRYVNSIIGDIRDRSRLLEALRQADPHIVIHMAAQPLVRDSYRMPVETYETNVLGTVYLLDAVRQVKQQGGAIKAVVNVTTDKCYENKEWSWGYREYEPFGGYDPYSSSKACSELVTAAYRSSFFHPADYAQHGVGVATARAGNVIGGGDWATDRLVPDCFRALMSGDPVVIRHPQAIRPWQHVLEPLSGYLLLAERLTDNGAKYAQGWNFGPGDDDAKPVERIVRQMCSDWGEDASYVFHKADSLHEAHYLKLDCSKAKLELGWHPRWNLQTAIGKITEWMRAFKEGRDIEEISFRQIEEYRRAGGDPPDEKRSLRKYFFEDR